jgi:hypothetical protein
MADSSQNQAISEIARDVVTHIAPQELPILQGVCEAYFDDPVKALKPLKSEDRVLGFGLDASATLLTPVVIAVVSEVFQLLVQIGKKAIEDAGAGRSDAKQRQFGRHLITSTLFRGDEGLLLAASAGHHLSTHGRRTISKAQVERCWR